MNEQEFVNQQNELSGQLPDIKISEISTESNFVSEIQEFDTEAMNLLLLGIPVSKTTKETIEGSPKITETREEVEEKKSQLKFSQQGSTKIVTVTGVFGIIVLSGLFGYLATTGQLRKNNTQSASQVIVNEQSPELTEAEKIKQLEAETIAMKTQLAISNQERKAGDFSHLERLTQDSQEQNIDNTDKPNIKKINPTSSVSNKQSSIPKTKINPPTVSPLISTSKQISQPPVPKPVSNHPIPLTTQVSSSPRNDTASREFPPLVKATILSPPTNIRENNRAMIITSPSPPLVQEHTYEEWEEIAMMGSYNFAITQINPQSNPEIETLNYPETPNYVDNPARRRRTTNLGDNDNTPVADSVVTNNSTSTNSQLPPSTTTTLVTNPSPPRELPILVPSESEIIQLKPLNLRSFNPAESVAHLLASYNQPNTLSDTATPLLTSDGLTEQQTMVEKYRSIKEPKLEPSPKQQGFVLSGTRIKASLSTPVFFSSRLLIQYNDQEAARFQFLVNIEEPLINNLGQQVLPQGSQVLFQVVDVLPNGLPLIQSVKLISQGQEYPLPSVMFSIRGNQGEVLLAKEKKLQRSEILRRDVLGLILNTATSVGNELTKPLSTTTTTNTNDGSVSQTQQTEDTRDVVGAVFKGAETLSQAVAARNEARIIELLSQQKLWVIDAQIPLELFVEQTFTF
jgi:hypothetical protein